MHMQKERIVFFSFNFWCSFINHRRLSGQTMIEGTFSVMVIVMLLLSMVKVFFWVGTDLSNRRAAHEQTLISPVPAGDINDNYRQIRPVFYEGTPIDGLAINSDIFGSDRLR